jgi:hypothetical protein
MPIEILLVEDNAGDIELTQEAFHAAKIINSLLKAIETEGPHPSLCCLWLLLHVRSIDDAIV